MTERELPDLLPCPFCGESSASVDDRSDDCLVTCDCCLAEGPLATIGCRDDDDDLDLELEAVTLWNQRKLGAVRPIVRNTIKE